MSAGARTPEELETLLEDAFVLRDIDAVTALFVDRAVFVANGSAGEHPPLTWSVVERFVSEARRIVQADDFALLLGERSAGVLHRGADRMWRYTIAVMTG